MDYKDITAVITSFKSETKILNCVKSLGKDFKIIIIENSNDKKLKEKLEKEYPNIKCILSDKNLGYAKGNNLGLTMVNTKYALIINPDAEVQNQAIDNFFLTANKNPNFAIIAPFIQEKNNQGFTINKKNGIFEVKNVKGFAMFLNLEQCKDVGFFDENFFIYFEEIDLCRRLKIKNKKIYLDSKIKIDHIGGSSHNQKINSEMELSRNWHWMWSTFYYNKKHFGYFNSIFKVSNKFFSSLIKSIYYTLTFNKIRKRIYYQRLSGLFNSIIGKDSWYRPKL